LTAPQRIQRRRDKGWKKPANTIDVTRSGKWGNRFRGPNAAAEFRASLEGRKSYYRGIHGIITFAELRRELGGQNVMCWCAPGQPCHGDVLLEFANRPVCEAP